jgi:hypothetical protein
MYDFQKLLLVNYKKQTTNSSQSYMNSPLQNNFAASLIECQYVYLYILVSGFGHVTYCN